MLTTFDQKLAEYLNGYQVNGWPVGNLILVMIALVLSMLLCGAVGLEREIRGRSAGLRTHLLVGMGSCVVMIVSIYGFPSQDSVSRDVARLAAQVVSGALKGAIAEADYDKAEKRLAAQMREAGRRVTELGGIIGHIKFVLTTPGKCGQISVTDVEETIRHFDGTASQVEGVAIVFAVEDDELVKILTETIGSILIREE